MRPFRAYRSIAWVVASVCGVACSVFPDQAVLPDSEGLGAGSGGSPVASGGATAIGGSTEPSGGAAQPSGGVESSAGAGNDAGANTAAGTTSAAGAGAGAGGTASCVPRHVLLTPLADAWIDAAQPDVNHGSDSQLFVLGGTDEQRTLVSFALPVATGSDVLTSATLVLTLTQPPNLGSSSRVLHVLTLSKSVKEKQVTWLSYANGAMKTWTTPGGDVSLIFGSGELTATDTALRLDTVSLVTAAYSAGQTELGLLVLDADADAANATPTPFAFGSKEGAPAATPQLDLEYCPP